MPAALLLLDLHPHNARLGIETVSRDCSHRTPWRSAFVEAFSLSQTKPCPSSVEYTSM